MQWLLHLLSINHSAQTDIYNELRQCQDIFHRNLLKGSLKEALRLYPVAPFITRFMPEDTIVDEYLIKRNVSLKFIEILPPPKQKKTFSR